MKHKNDVISGSLALLSGILMVIAAFIGDTWKPLWLITAVLQFINAGLILKRSRDSGKNSKAPQKRDA